MSATSATLLAALELTECAAEQADRAFTAVTQEVPWPKAYGGDMVAQAVLAALRTVPDDRDIHSMHSYFLRPVDVGGTVRYEVETVRDGRGYSTRQVRGIQHGKTAYLCTASFSTAALHPSGSSAPVLGPAAPELPGPEDLPTSEEYLAGVDGSAAAYWSRGRSFDQRHVPGPVYLTVDGGPTAHQAVWVRAFDTLPDDPQLHRAALAYVCDYTILEPSLRLLGLAWAEPGLQTASLDHAMWFHRSARVDEWLLYAQESAAVGDERGLNLGRFFTRDGELVATVAQEGMIRPAAPAGPPPA